MAKRPDRFERMVGRVKGKFPYIEANTEGYLISDSDVITLLRKEHLAVVRMVRKELARSLSYYSTRTEAIQRVMDKLTERAK